MEKIMVVVVLYRQTFSETPSYSLLQQKVKEQVIELLVYDNSPQAQADELFALEAVHYVHDAANSGLAIAYNQALKLAEKKRLPLLITLDDDTRLTEEYFACLQEATQQHDSAVFLPQIMAERRQISPIAASSYIDRNFSALPAGSTQERVMGINSGAAFSVAFLSKLGGFNPAFPLDFLDHWLFWALFQQRLTVTILPARLNHELSVLDYSKMTATRYASILQAERLFYTKYDQIQLKRHRQQLALRTAKQFIKVKNRAIWRQTWREFWQIRGV